MPTSVFNSLLKHPLTEIGLKRFLEDWEKVKAERLALSLEGRRAVNLAVIAYAEALHERIAAAMERYGERFLKRIFTGQEIAECRGRAEAFSIRFAATFTPCVDPPDELAQTGGA